MKKRWIAMGCALVLSLTCFGCSSTSNEVASTEATETIENVKTVETEEMIQKTQTSSASDKISAMEQIHAACEQAVPVGANQTVTAEGVVEFTIEQAYMTEEIYPSNIQGSYSYLEDQEDSIYAVFQGTVKNLSDEKINFGTFVAGGLGNVVSLFLAGDTYYVGSWLSEEPDGSSVSGTIEAGESAVVYLFAAIPNGEITDIQEIEGVLTVFKDMKEYVQNSFTGVVDWDLCTNKFYISMQEAEQE